MAAGATAVAAWASLLAPGSTSGGPSSPDRMATRGAGAYRTLVNKYYVDELYDAAIVRPLVAVSDTVALPRRRRRADRRCRRQRARASGAGARFGVLKYLQSGLTQGYLVMMVLGVGAAPRLCWFGSAMLDVSRPRHLDDRPSAPRWRRAPRPPLGRRRAGAALPRARPRRVGRHLPPLAAALVRLRRHADRLSVRRVAAVAARAGASTTSSGIDGISLLLVAAHDVPDADRAGLVVERRRRSP